MGRPDEIPDVSPAEFDALMERAGLQIRPEWRQQMFTEYAQLRMNMNVIHALIAKYPDPIDIQRAITSGRIEE